MSPLIGKYKRTMTPFKPPTEETRGKVQSEIGEMMRLFKSFIALHRPKMDVELVATGEVRDNKLHRCLRDYYRVKQQ